MALLLAAAVVLTACGDDGADGGADEGADDGAAGDERTSGSSSVATPPDPDAGGLAGTYDTRVTLAGGTCQGLEVQDNPTTIEQDADALTVTHATLTFSGTVDPAGTFTTAPAQVQVGPDAHLLSVTGSVADGHLSAQVTAEVTGSRSCEYTVSWEGDKAN